MTSAGRMRNGGSTRTREHTTIRGSTATGGRTLTRTTMGRRRREGAVDMVPIFTDTRRDPIRMAWDLLHRRRRLSNNPRLGRGRRLPAATAERERSAAAVTHTPPTANAPTATSFGSTAFSNPCRRILRPPLFPCRPFREECRREHHFTGRMASRCLQPQRGPRKAARIRIRRLTTPPRCIRRRGHHLRHTTRKMPGAGGRVRQRRSTARDRLRQTILMMTTLAGGLPFRSIATARHPQATTRISKAPMTGNGLPAPGIAALAGPCSHSRRCGTPRPVHRHRCSSPNLHRNKKASSNPLPAGTLTP